MRVPVVALAVAVAHSLSAAVTNLQPITPLELASSTAPPQVTSGPPGWFLAGGHRVTAGGERIDSAPLPGSSGSILEWENGWIALHENQDEDGGSDWMCARSACPVTLNRS